MRARSILSLASVAAAGSILCLAAACGGSESSGGTTNGASGSGTAGSGTAGSSTAGGAGAAGKPLPKTFGETDCWKCVGTSCSAESGACTADTECKAYVDCIAACPPKSQHEADPDCQAACKAPSMPAGQSAVGAFGTCFKAKVDEASSPCAMACGE